MRTSQVWYVTATILIVDDSTFIVEGLTALFCKNYRVIPCSGGDECLEVLRNEKPDVIVLDILMEPMDGWETLAQIKGNPATRHIPILLFSAKKISPEEAEEHREWIADFLIKPVNPRELVGAIEKILHHEQQSRSVLYHWTKAGIPQEKIREYLLLSSNLEVDQSLLAVMKKEMDHCMVSRAQYNDLASSIAVLGDRIESGRVAMHAFFRETGLSLPPVSVIPEPDSPAPELPPPGVVADTPAVHVGITDVSISPTPLIMYPPAGTDPVEFPASLPEQRHAISPGPDPCVEIGRDQPGVRPGDLTEAGDVPAHLPEPAGEDAGTIVPPAVAQESPELPAEESGIGYIHIPSYADPVPIRDVPGLDQFFEPVTAPAAPGTVNPARISPKPGAYPESRQPPRGNADPPAAAPSPGFFSRIIAVIMSLFGRGRT